MDKCGIAYEIAESELLADDDDDGRWTGEDESDHGRSRTRDGGAMIPEAPRARHLDLEPELIER